MGRRNYSKFFSEDDIKIYEPTAPKEPKEELPVAEPETKEGTVVNCEMVNVRTKPAPDAPIASIIMAGEKVEVLDGKSTKNYYAVKTNHNIEGFIKRDFLEV